MAKTKAPTKKDDKAARYRMTVGYVGEDGIKAGTAYRLDDNHKFVEA